MRTSPFNILFLILLSMLLASCTQKGQQKAVPSTLSTQSISTSTSGVSSLEQSEKRYPLLVSKDFGVTWKNAGEGLPEDLEVSFIEAMGEEMVIATDKRGIFISQKERKSWKPIGTHLPGQKINALHVLGGAIFAGVHREGIYRTTDKGATWESLNYNLSNLNVQAICEVGRQLLLGTDDGIFKLDETGRKWEATSVQDQILSIYEYDGKLVAGSSIGSLLSEDGGRTWTWIHQEGAVHYTHNIGQRIVELMLNGDLFYSDDWGKTWDQHTYGPRKGAYVYEIVEAGPYHLLCNNYGIHRSADQGKSWSLVYSTESMAFFDFLVDGGLVYGGTRNWDEYRKRKQK